MGVERQGKGHGTLRQTTGVFVKDKSKGLYHPVNLVHSGSLEFDLHQHKWSEVEYSDNFPQDGSINGSQDKYRIDFKFKTCGEVSHRPLHKDTRLVGESKALINYMFGFSVVNSDEVCELYFCLEAPAKDIDEIRDFVETLQSLQDDLPSSFGFNPYLNMASNLMRQYGQLKSRLSYSDPIALAQNAPEPVRTDCHISVFFHGSTP